MKATHRGHEITVKREQCLAGNPRLYVSIFRLSDGYECTSFSEDSDEKIADMMRYMKERVDAELATDDPWMEKRGIDEELFGLEM